jgi:hypothetical protein
MVWGCGEVLPGLNAPNSKSMRDGSDPRLVGVVYGRGAFHIIWKRQTIIVSRESSAGKTESAKLIMRFLTSVTGSEGDGP